MTIKSRLNLLTCLSILLLSCSNKVDKHIGEWKSNSEHTDLILDESNHAIFVVDNHVTGGDEFLVDGRKAELKYEIDYSKNPIWLDLIVSSHGENGGEISKRRLKGIIKFLTDKKIEYKTNLNVDDPRPNGFDKGNILILDKQN